MPAGEHLGGWVACHAPDPTATEPSRRDQVRKAERDPVQRQSPGEKSNRHSGLLPEAAPAKLQEEEPAASYVAPVPEDEETLRSAYRAFNARDVEAAVALMHPEVDWPNAWEGGRVVGRMAVRDYWNRQFAAISSKVEPEAFTKEPDGSVTVDVHQVVHDAGTGALISDSRVRHRYRLEHGLVVRMDVLEPGDQV